MTTTTDPWTMPDWMEPFRELIVNTGGNPVEELVNDQHTTAVVNAVRAGLIVAVASQVALLGRLHRDGHLVPPATMDDWPAADIDPQPTDVWDLCRQWDQEVNGR
jgi:hypothetical protein